MKLKLKVIGDMKTLLNQLLGVYKETQLGLVCDLFPMRLRYNTELARGNQGLCLNDT